MEIFSTSMYFFPVVDGMCSMYYDYADKKAEAVAELRQELFGEVVYIVSDESPRDVLVCRRRRNF